MGEQLRNAITNVMMGKTAASLSSLYRVSIAVASRLRKNGAERSTEEIGNRIKRLPNSYGGRMMDRHRAARTHHTYT